MSAAVVAEDDRYILCKCAVQQTSMIKLSILPLVPSPLSKCNKTRREESPKNVS
jgi:hypothetical protein